LGFGDIKMMAMVGAFLGWRFAWLTIFLGSVLGVVLGSAYIFGLRKGARYELPFGTFLGFTGLGVVLWGPGLLRWYLGT
jgi:leader peptidase (prepilin peptidase)/N-methyltransferase